MNSKIVILQLLLQVTTHINNDINAELCQRLQSDKPQRLF